MSFKIFLFLFGLITFSCVIEAKDLLKKLNEKELLLLSYESFRTILHTDAHTKNGSEHSTEWAEFEATNFVKLLIWHITIAYIEMMTFSPTNLTFIGWQRIYDDKGHIKEIKTIQLVIPPRIPPKAESKLETNIVDDDIETDDGEFLHEVRELKSIFRPVAQADSVIMEWYKDGEEKLLVYLDEDEFYTKYDNFGIYDKTKIGPIEEVENFVKNLKPTLLGEPSVAKYVDGKYISPNSNIPYFLGRVVDHHEATDKMILDGPEIITKISLKNPKDEIPKQLAAAYNQLYPNYEWKVRVNANNSYIIRDVSVELTYDNFGFDESDMSISYLVYGSKKE